MRTIPFKISSLHGQTEGMVRFEDGVLTVEFRAWTWTALAKRLRAVQIPVEGLDAADFRQTLFGAHLTLRGRSMRVLEGIPGSRRGEVRLQFFRRDREAARRLASALSLRLTEFRLSRLQDDGEDLYSPVLNGRARH